MCKDGKNLTMRILLVAFPYITLMYLIFAERNIENFRYIIFFLCVFMFVNALVLTYYEKVLQDLIKHLNDENEQTQEQEEEKSYVGRCFSEGSVKKGGVNPPPTTPKQNIRPPAQKPKKDDGENQND